MHAIRQRPGTAKGFVFLSLEDETGIANITVSPKLFEKQRLILSQEPLLRIHGTLQNLEGITSIKADTIESLHKPPRPVANSHDFH